jgi:uncharacterized protein YutE (UPF0331/DUF86 family)
MKYNGIIEKKLRVIEDKLDNIQEWNIDSFDKLKSSSLLQNAVERALQVAVESMIDISERILALENVAPQTTSAANIEKLQTMNILSNQEEYQDMVRFRNFIVHRYEKIDLDIIYDILKNKLKLFAKFIEDIRNS